MVIVTRKSKLRKKIFLYLKLSTTTVQSEPRFPFQSTTEGFEQFSGTVSVPVQWVQIALYDCELCNFSIVYLNY